MCGIAGGVGYLEDGVLDRMAKKMHHRGPDNIETYSNSLVHLAHVRLSIIDLSVLSNQPLWDYNEELCIVFNGEIYNYKQLKEKLLLRGYKFNSGGDAEVLLNLYIEYGSQCLEMLNGIFSFAIWNPSLNELFIARDNFGTKPLYYCHNSDGFYFASEMKSLLEIPTVSRELNHDSLFRSLVFLWSPGEETIVKSIKKVLPAHFMLIKNGIIEEYKKFWGWPKYQPETKPAELHVESVFNAMKDAVNEQMVSDVKVGAFLSGGLDSSLIVALASEGTVDGMQCFTIDSNPEQLASEGIENDLPYAKKVANYLKADLNILRVSPDISRLLPKMIYHLDELQADPAPINVLLISELARNNGIKVLLSGAGGDDLFTGYRRHYAIKSERFWSWMPSTIRKTLSKATSYLPKDSPNLRRISKAFQYAGLSENERLLSYFFWLDPNKALSLFKDPNLISTTPFKFLLDEIDEFETNDPIEKILILEQKYFLVDHNFNYTDKMSMAAGVEVRVPFLDKGVIKAASEVPSNLKQNGRVGKWVLKKAAEKVLPKDIIYRPKSGFGAPLRSWLKGDLATMIDEFLSAESIDKRGVFNSAVVHELIDADRAGKADYSYPIFALLCFEIWCQEFLD